MIYKLIKKVKISVFMSLFVCIGLVSCYDDGYEEFVAPTGNVNNIQPNTLFTTTTSAADNLSIVFRSFSTDAVSYIWDFGDGNVSTEEDPNYKYAVGGLYEVKLTTTSSDGLIAEDSSEVAPVFVDFNFTTVDSEVIFDNVTSGASKLVWDFGDGDTLEWNSEDTEDDPKFNPVHIYSTADTFEVTLTATNFLGAEVSVSKNIEGLVLSTVPDFTFTISDLTASFTDASLLAVSYSWDFGDGSTSTEASPSHTFPAVGAYDVTLTTTNDAGVSKSITKAVPVGGLEATFKAIVLNGTFDEFTKNTGDNADAWDMTPNNTVENNEGETVDSPYVALWKNSDLNSYIDATYCTDEQPSSSSNGNFDGSSETRAGKLNSTCRRLYQVVAVEPGVEYTFTIDTRAEVEGLNTEVFILNKEITTEVGIEDSTDGYLQITNDFNADKATSASTFTTNTFRFTASSNSAVIYVRSLTALDGSSEVFLDNVDIITPGF